MRVAIQRTAGAAAGLLADATGYDERADTGGEAVGDAATVGRPTDEGGGGKLGMRLACTVPSEKGGTKVCDERRGGTGGGEGVRGSGLLAAAVTEAGMMPPLLDGRRGSSSFSSAGSLRAREDGVLDAGGEVAGRTSGLGSAKRTTSGSSLSSSSSVPSSSSSSCMSRCFCSSSASLISSSLISTGSLMLVMDCL